MVDPAELLHKNRGHFLCNIPDNALQLPLGGKHIVPLLRQIAVALIDPGILVNGTQIGGAQSGNFSLQFTDPTISRGHGFNFSPVLHGCARRQAIGIPELIHDLALLHGAGDLFLLQQGAGPLHIQDILALLLGLPFASGSGGLGLGPILQHGLQQLPHGTGFRVILTLPVLQCRQLLLQTARILPNGLDQGKLFLPVSFHGGLQLPQIGHMGKGGRALGLQRRLPGLVLRHFFRNGSGGFYRFGLTALQAGQLLTGLGQLAGIYLNFAPLGRQTLPVGVLPLGQCLLLPPGGGLRLHNGTEQNLMLLFLPLQPQHLILRLPELIPGSAQLELHLIEQPLGLLQRRLRRQLLLLQCLVPGGQLFQLVGPGENPRVPVDGAAGHGAAGIHHLTVQGDNPEPVVVFFRHGNGRIQVLGNHRSAQQIQHNIAVFFIAGYQL